MSLFFVLLKKKHVAHRRARRFAETLECTPTVCLTGAYWGNDIWKGQVLHL